MIANITPGLVDDGVGLGTVIAVVVSWSRNRSILWAIFHGLCSWLYVIYFALTEGRTDESGRAEPFPGLIVAIVTVALIGIFISFVFFRFSMR